MAEHEQEGIRVILRHEPTTRKTCPVCGREFDALRGQFTCSTSCRNKQSYRRHAEARREARRRKYREGKAAPAGPPNPCG